MKMLYYFGIFVAIFANIPVSYSSYHDTNLVTQIKPNPTDSSKPTSAYVKFASVHFLPASNRMLLKLRCASGYTYEGDRCKPNPCDRNKYPLTTQPDPKKGTIESCQSGHNFYFGYLACNDGYHKDKNLCVENDCSSYPYAELPTDDSIGVINTEACILPTAEKYQYKSCYSGWTYNSGACNETVCNGSVYPYADHPGSKAGGVISCKSGLITHYGYSSCNEGWDKNGGYCNVHNCDATTYPYTSNPGADAGKQITCKSAENTYWGYTECNDGWTLRGGQCIENPCEGYSLTACVSKGVCSSCKRGATMKYKIDTCFTGYYISSSTCTANKCEGYSLTACPPYGSCSTCLSGEDNKFLLNSCPDGWYVNNGSCKANPCTGYVANACPERGTCSTCLSGVNTKYAVLGCENGWYVNGSLCTPNTCTGYTLGSCPSNGNCTNCLSGTATKYALSSCNEGWYVNGNYCTENACTGYEATSNSIAYCTTVSSCKKGTSYKYKCSTCNSGYRYFSVAHYYNDYKPYCYKYCTSASACKVGDVFVYQDTPIGIVFYIDSSSVRIIAKRLTSNKWVADSGRGCTGATIVKGTGSAYAAVSAADMDGRGNTTKHINYLNSIGYTLSSILFDVNNYAPSVCASGSFCGKGKWYIGASGETKAFSDAGLYDFYEKFYTSSMGGASSTFIGTNCSSLASCDWEVDSGDSWGCASSSVSYNHSIAPMLMISK